MFRVAFDPSLPVVASKAFAVGERAFREGDAVDWQALGVTEQMLLDWWRAFLVHHPVVDPMDALHAATEEVAPELLSATALESGLVAFKASPGVTVNVETPTQRGARRGRRS